MKFLIVCALEQESRGCFEQIPDSEIMYTGLGKINAAISLTKKLSYNNAYIAVINLGTVGSINYPPGTVVQISHFIQRDMLAYPLAPKYHTPFDNTPYDIPCSTIDNFLPTLVCGTGDSFVSEFLQFGTCDMEGYALAKVCREFSVPFYSLKYISDTGQASDWENQLEAASIALECEAKKLLKILNKNPDTPSFGYRELVKEG
jgi:adenosylhomocysteine nucleosidase